MYGYTGEQCRCSREITQVLHDKREALHHINELYAKKQMSAEQFGIYLGGCKSSNDEKAGSDRALYTNPCLLIHLCGIILVMIGPRCPPHFLTGKKSPFFPS